MIKIRAKCLGKRFINANAGISDLISQPIRQLLVDVYLQLKLNYVIVRDTFVWLAFQHWNLTCSSSPIDDQFHKIFRKCSIENGRVLREKHDSKNWSAKKKTKYDEKEKIRKIRSTNPLDWKAVGKLWSTSSSRSVTGPARIFRIVRVWCVFSLRSSSVVNKTAPNDTERSRIEQHRDS